MCLTYVWKCKYLPSSRLIDLFLIEEYVTNKGLFIRKNLICYKQGTAVYLRELFEIQTELPYFVYWNVIANSTFGLCCVKSSELLLVCEILLHHA